MNNDKASCNSEALLRCLALLEPQGTLVFAFLEGLSRWRQTFSDSSKVMDLLEPVLYPLGANDLPVQAQS